MSDDPPAPLPSSDEPAPAQPQPAEAEAPPVEASPQEPAPAAAKLEASPAEPTPPAAKPAATVANLRRLAFLAIPLIAVLELGAHIVQITTVVSDEQWLAARDAVRAMMKPTDLVAMAPYWTDPLGRELFKDGILSIAREARPDATRFPRAIEVGIREEHLPELADWKVESTKKVGPVTLTVYDNPSYTPILDDLVDHGSPERMAVSSSGGECTFMHGRVETGALGFGPAIPGDRFECPGGGHVAVTILQPTDYRPHRCVFAPPLGAGKPLLVRFLGVTFGDLLHGHAGLDWDSAAHTNEAPVVLAWKVGGRTLGRIVTGNADGWKSFALSTGDMKGQKGEIDAEITSPSSRNRLFCFEADTR